MIKSVQNNAALNVRILGVFLVSMLRKLIRAIPKYANAKLYTALFLAAFFGFFRLDSLLSNAIAQFDRTPHPIQNDFIFGPPGFHLIMTYSKICKLQAKCRLYSYPS